MQKLGFFGTISRLMSLQTGAIFPDQRPFGKFGVRLWLLHSFSVNFILRFSRFIWQWRDVNWREITWTKVVWNKLHCHSPRAPPTTIATDSPLWQFAWTVEQEVSTSKRTGGPYLVGTNRGSLSQDEAAVALGLGVTTFPWFFATMHYGGLISPHHKVWFDDQSIIQEGVKTDVISRTTAFLRVWVAHTKGLMLNIPHRLHRPFSACLSCWTMCYRLPWNAGRLERIDQWMFQCLGRQARAPRDLVHADLLAKVVSL